MIVFMKKKLLIKLRTSGFDPTVNVPQTHHIDV